MIEEAGTKVPLRDKIVEYLIYILINRVASKHYRGYLSVAMMVGSMVLKETAQHKPMETFEALLQSAREYHDRVEEAR